MFAKSKFNVIFPVASVSLQQQQQQQQHFISPHNMQEIKIYNNSTDDDRGAGCPK